MGRATIYLIPIALHNDASALNGIPAYIADAVKSCSVFFVENERTARRFLKKISADIIIDDYEWHTIDDTKTIAEEIFRRAVLDKKIIGIMSEAGCPGIADPGQKLVHIAQELNAKISPLVGPNAIILALMASGMNGQYFQFAGYLPIDADERKKKIRELEADSQKRDCTQIFIETPYRNNQLLNDIFTVASDETNLCIAADITSSSEFIRTKKISEWKREKVNFHKRPAIFLLYAAK
jgi:16S rRNA (cytidine1402-2'-O)-methyltransferase